MSLTLSALFHASSRTPSMSATASTRFTNANLRLKALKFTNSNICHVEDCPRLTDCCPSSPYLTMPSPTLPHSTEHPCCNPCFLDLTPQIHKPKNISLEKSLITLHTCKRMFFFLNCVMVSLYVRNICKNQTYIFGSRWSTMH